MPGSLFAEDLPLCTPENIKKFIAEHGPPSSDSQELSVGPKLEELELGWYMKLVIVWKGEQGMSWGCSRYMKLVEL